ncbi:hypothetical protein WN943_024742 [Citrus x changshan-huyou]
MAKPAEAALCERRSKTWTGPCFVTEDCEAPSDAVSAIVSNSPSPLSQPPSQPLIPAPDQMSNSMSDNVEINSSSVLVLSHNVEDKTDNEVEEISVSTVNDSKSKEETGKKKKASEAWEHFT